MPRWLAWLVLLGACEPSVSTPPVVSPAAPPVEPSAPADDRACRERVARMRPRLEEAAARPPEALVDPDVVLPYFAVDVGFEVPQAVTVVLQEDGVKVDGADASDGAALTEMLERKRQLYETIHGGDEPEGGFVAVVQASAELDVARLLPALEQIAGAGYLPQLVVRVPDAPKIVTEPPAWLTAELARWDAGEGSPTAWREALVRAMGSCRDVLAVFEQKDLDPSARLPHVLGAMPDIVMSCGCDLDVDALEALLVRFSVGRGRRYRVLPLPHRLGAARAPLHRGDDVEDLVRRRSKHPEPFAPLEYVLE